MGGKDFDNQIKNDPPVRMSRFGDPDENRPLNGAPAPTARTRAPKQSTGLFLSLRSRPFRFSSTNKKTDPE